MTWERLTLSEIAAGGVFSDGDWVESKDQDVAGTVRLTQLADVGVGTFRDRSNRWLREDQAARLNCTFLEPNDVLIARMPDPIGRACLVPETVDRWVTVVDVAILRVRRSDINPRYVMWAINSPEFHEAVASLQSGTTRKRISRKNLATLSIPVPPLEEQRRIVATLEDHLSHLDAADDYLRTTLRRAEAFGLSRLSHARRTLHAVEMKTIGAVAETQLGKMLDSKKQTGEPTPYLRNINVRWGAFDLDDLQATPMTDQDRARFDVRDGDIFACEGGEPGRCAVWHGQGQGLSFQKAIHRLRVRHPSEISPEFLTLMLTDVVRSGRADPLFTGTTIKHLPQEKLRSIEVPIPDRDTQAAIVAEFSQTTESVSRLRSTIHAQQRYSAALRRSLLAAAFSGRLSGSAAETPKNVELIDA